MENNDIMTLTATTSINSIDFKPHHQQRFQTTSSAIRTLLFSVRLRVLVYIGKVIQSGNVEAALFDCTTTTEILEDELWPKG